MCLSQSPLRMFLVEHRAFRLGESVVLCAPMRVHTRTPFIAARRLCDDPTHGCIHSEGYYVVYENGKRLAEFPGKDV